MGYLRRGAALGAVLAAVLVLTALPGVAAAKSDQNLRGTRISLFRGSIEVAANEPYFVRHGWQFPMEDTTAEPGWRSMSAAERQEHRDDSVWRFELFVDGLPIALEGSFHAVQLPALGLTKPNFVEFAANAFLPGTYEFEGLWYGDMDDDDVSELEFTRTIDVTFT